MYLYIRKYINTYHAAILVLINKFMILVGGTVFYILKRNSFSKATHIK